MTDNDHAVEKATTEIEQIIRDESRKRFLRPRVELIPEKEVYEPEPAPIIRNEPEPEPEPEKIDHRYLPLDALEEVSKALMYGAQKGDAWSWDISPITWMDRLSKAQRHMFEFQKGNNIDPKTGLSHLACAISQLMFLQSYVLTGKGTDDRYKR